MIVLDLSILNQKGTPMFNSDTFANRPNFGILGRIFISINTAEIYRDTGTSWVLISDAGAGSSNLQNVTDNGSTTTNAITTAGLTATNLAGSGSQMVIVDNAGIFGIQAIPAGTVTSVDLSVPTGLSVSGNPITSAGTLALALAAGFVIPTQTTLNGFVTLATTQTITAQKTFTERVQISNSGVLQALDILQSSGSGIALNISKGGNGEGLFINKTSGSGNAATIIGTLNATTLVKNGGTASQFLKADGTVDSTAYTDVNIYNSNGTFTAARTITNAGFNLSLSGTGNLQIGSTTPFSFTEKLQITGTAGIEHTYTQAGGIFRSGTNGQVTINTAAAATYSAGMSYSALQGYQINNFSGNNTLPNSIIMSAFVANSQLNFASASTILMTQGSGGILRTYSPIKAFFNIQNPAAAGSSIDHVAGVHVLSPFYIGANTPTITNFYGVAVNNTSEHLGVTITNRYAFYQDGATDRNFFAGNTLIGTLIEAGFKLDVNGTVRVGALTGTSAIFSSSVTASSATLAFVSNTGCYYRLRDNNGSNAGGYEFENSYAYGVSSLIKGSFQFGNKYQSSFETTARIILTTAADVQYAALSFDGNSGSATFSSSVNAVSGFLQSANTNAVVDIFTLSNPSNTSSGVRQKFANGYGDLAAIRVLQIDNGAGADNGKIEFQTSTDTVLSTKLTILDTGAATFSSTIQTAAPSGGTAKPFKIGDVATVTPTSQNRTIQIEIDGTTFFLTAKTTND